MSTGNTCGYHSSHRPKTGSPSGWFGLILFMKPLVEFGCQERGSILDVDLLIWRLIRNRQARRPPIPATLFLSDCWFPSCAVSVTHIALNSFQGVQERRCCGYFVTEENKLSKDCCLEMVTLAQGMSNGKIEEFHSSEPFSLEETIILKEKSYCKASWSDDGRGCIDHDAFPLKFVKLRLFDFNSQLPNGRSTKNSSASDQTEEDMIFDCHTPTKSIFDLSAPAPDDFILAPKKKKLRDSYLPLCRRLNYDCSFSEANLEADAKKESEEEQILESVFTSLLELIIFMQLAEVSAVEMVYPNTLEVCMTPISSTVLKNKDCPPAPVKPKSNFKRCSRSVRRKLDFGACLN
ncbi:hypothetical protein HPP92_018079 [Vanilla planifolia]|uniref:Uncharacterized protein n=1 Tax=Vanilla planifolia TaxID=51239 RepID=A0A835QBC7_VANPL|nr:hypothetical protein HPP92_018079 [Vanilla planifolia]